MIHRISVNVLRYPGFYDRVCVCVCFCASAANVCQIGDIHFLEIVTIDGK